MLEKNHIKFIYILLSIVIILLISLLLNINKEPSNKNIKKQEKNTIDPAYTLKKQMDEEVKKNLEEIRQTQMIKRQQVEVIKEDEKEMLYILLENKIKDDNKNLPIMVDEITELFKNELENKKTLVNNLRIIVLPKGTLQEDDAKKYLEEGIYKLRLPEVCKLLNMKALKENGFSMKHKYYDSDYNFIAENEYNIEDCRKNGF